MGNVIEELLFFFIPPSTPGTRCADGYYGNPTVPGEACVPCECNGNVDPSEPGHCDPVTGECLKCLRNTAGTHCERCADGFYGDAVDAKNCRGECKPCKVKFIIWFYLLESSHPSTYMCHKEFSLGDKLSGVQ